MYESFAETRFQIGIPKSSGGYKFRTTMVRAGSGIEKRVEHNLQPSFPGLENQPMYEGDLGNLIVTQCELDYITNFFNARRGRNQGFRFKNWADYKCTHLPDYGHKGEINATYTQGITYPATADGTNKKFKMVKAYFSQGDVTYKALHKIVDNTASVYVNGVLDESVFIDVNNGEIHFETAPAQGSDITHNCQFDLPVRFDTDEMIGASEFHDSETGRLCYTYGGLPVIEMYPSLPVSIPIFPAPPPFYGGQCEVFYSFTYRTPDGRIVKSGGSGSVRGAIRFIKKELLPSGFTPPNDYAWYFTVGGTDGDDVTFVEEGVYRLFLNYAQDGEPTFIGLETYDKRTNSLGTLPDNCGDPPAI